MLAQNFYLQNEDGMHVFKVAWPGLLSEKCGLAESYTSYQYMHVYICMVGHVWEKSKAVFEH